MRNIFLVLVASNFALILCNPKTEKTMNSTANEKIINQYFDHFNKHEFTEMAKMYSETAEFKDPSLGSGIFKQSRQQIIDKYTALAEIFPDLKDQVVQIYPSGENHVIVEFISTGTAPDETQFELAICTIFTLENGIITKDFTYYDNFVEEEMK